MLEEGAIVLAHLPTPTSTPAQASVPREPLDYRKILSEQDQRTLAVQNEASQLLLPSSPGSRTIGLRWS